MKASGTWTRVGFRDQDGFHSALALVAGLGARTAHTARHHAANASVWSVEELNVPASAALGWQTQTSHGLVSPEHEGCSYLYFSPGAAEALRLLLPRNWVHDPCEPPPAHLAVPLFGADDDSHFGSY
jgi:hypothetical protein